MQKIGYFKYWIALVLIATIGVFSFSCNDTDNPGNEGEVLTQAEAEGLINAVFGPLQTLSSSYSFLLESATETTISFEGADDADGPLVSLFETTPSNWYAIKVFNRLYQSIGAANLAIEKISDPKEGANVTGKELLIARARFFRGYNLFQLVQLYGEVPIILSTSQKDVTTRASINDVYTQIVKDLTEAIPDLPANDALKWHPTKAAANTILAKAYLTWGQNPLSQTELEQIKSSKQDPVHTVDNTKLQKAIEYADKVIADGSYRLLNDYNSIWGGGANGAAPENNAEVIFSIYHDGDGIDAQGNHQTHCGFTWPGQATKDPHISYADITLENRIPEGDPRREYSYATSISYDPAGFDAAAKDTLDYIDILTWPISIVRPGKWIHR
ncbi:MAG: RagB/SusD family nutrient uptake outer membrane protein, partial [Candidatus Symbiothrix sp.]|nr:RagB/SusD family nutrient uptake outer membrane protein [Candidatus Symbiothrix sp.]